MSRSAIAIAAALAFAATLPAVPAQAQRDRVFVASYGSDSNPCTFLSPCKTFQQAVDVVAVGGEVTAIDSAGFGPITITQSITITSPPGVEAGIVPTSGGDAITINTTTAADITLRGLTLEGTGVGYRGVNVISTIPAGSMVGGTLNVVACVVKGFTGSGIIVQPTLGMGIAVPNMNVVITDSLFTGNGAAGIKLDASLSGPVLNGSIYRTVVSGNGTGIEVDGGTYSAVALLADSYVDHNNNTAILVNSSIFIMKNTTATNTNHGNNTDIEVMGAGFLYMYRNTVASLNNGNGAYTDGTNNIGSVSGNSLTFQSPQ